MSRQRMRPKSRIVGYPGPYKKDMLEGARQELLNIIDSRDTVIWSRIRHKTGIFGNGERDTSFSGWGPASCEFSHADLKSSSETNLSEDLDNFASSSQTHYQSSTDQISTVSDMKRASPDSVIYESSSTPSVSLHRKRKNSSSEIIILDSEEEEAMPIKNARYDNSTKFIPLDSGIKESVSVERSTNNLLGKGENLDNSKSFKSNEIVDAEIFKEGEISESGGMLEDGEIVDDCLDEVETYVFESKSGNEKSDLSDLDCKNDYVSLENSQSVFDAAPDMTCQKVVFKCDFCNVVTDTESQMDSHLKHMVHYSASSFCSTSENIPVILKERLVVVSKSALYKRVIAVCPAKNCEVVFATIHECILHYNLKHDCNSPPLYGLVKVVDTLPCRIYKMNISCASCGKIFKSRNKFAKHIVKSGHLPFKQKKDLKCYLFCSACRQFYKTFASACSHKSPAHHGKINDGILPLKVLYGTRKEIHSLPNGSKTDVTDKTSKTTDTCSITVEYDVKENNLGTETNPPIADAEVCYTGDAEEPEKANTNAGGLRRIESLAGLEFNSDTGIKQTLEGNSPSDGMVEEGNSRPERSLELDESYKCDYCDFVSDDGDSVWKHLKHKKHSSASLVLLNSAKEPVYVKKPTAVNCNKHEQSLMAICPVPNCNQVFQDIYVCTEHYCQVHDGEADPIYAIAPIQTQKTLIYNFENGYFQPKFPLGDCVTSRSDLAYKCFMCSCKVTYSNQTLLLGHLSKSHRPKREQVGAVVFVTFFLVSKDRVRHSMLPFQNNKEGEAACIRRKVKSLKRLKKSVKSSKRQFTVKIQELKKLEKC